MQLWVIFTKKLLDDLIDGAIVEVIVNPRVGVPTHRGQKWQHEEEVISHVDATVCLSLISQTSPDFPAFFNLLLAREGLPWRNGWLFEVQAVI